MKKTELEKRAQKDTEIQNVLTQCRTPLDCRAVESDIGHDKLFALHDLISANVHNITGFSPTMSAALETERYYVYIVNDLEKLYFVYAVNKAPTSFDDAIITFLLKESDPRYNELRQAVNGADFYIRHKR
jgi:hypothetical protein